MSTHLLSQYWLWYLAGTFVVLVLLAWAKQQWENNQYEQYYVRALRTIAAYAPETNSHVAPLLHLEETTALAVLCNLEKEGYIAFEPTSDQLPFQHRKPTLTTAGKRYLYTATTAADGIP